VKLEDIVDAIRDNRIRRAVSLPSIVLTHTMDQLANQETKR